MGHKRNTDTSTRQNTLLQGYGETRTTLPGIRILEVLSNSRRISQAFVAIRSFLARVRSEDKLTLVKRHEHYVDVDVGVLILRGRWNWHPV